MVGELSNLSKDNYIVNNNEVLFFYTPFITSFSNTIFYNGHPPPPINNSYIDLENIGQIKLKDMRLVNRRCKSKDQIEELLEYQISFNSYMRIRSAILNCPSFTLNRKKVYKTFEL